MYIEFQLEYTYSYAESFLKEYLDAWGKKYQIKYRTKPHKNTYRLTFDNDDTYTLFCMTWPHCDNWLNYRVVRDLNNKI